VSQGVCHALPRARAREAHAGGVRTEKELLTEKPNRHRLRLQRKSEQSSPFLGRFEHGLKLPSDMTVSTRPAGLQLSFLVHPPTTKLPAPMGVSDD
jgi:hypothetical protein